MLYNNGILLDQCIVTTMLYNNGILLDQCIVTYVVQ